MPTGLMQKLIFWEQFISSGDLTAYLNCFVKISSGWTVAVAGNGADPIGVLYEQNYSPTVAAAANQQVSVVKPTGICLIKAGAAFSAGAKLMPNTNGDGTALTATTGNFVGAIALEAATAAGDLVSCYIQASYKMP